jgi:small subunit ribosomal protein S7
MRRRRAKKREIDPDPIYHDLVVSKLINIVLQKGKKNVAEKIVYGALNVLKEKTGKNPLDVFKQAVENVRPLLETKSRRVGGATYQVPVSVRPDRSNTLALRWMRTFAKQRKGKPMMLKLAEEMLDAYNRTGSSFKKREDTHKMAESNRAFAHYRW